MAHQRVFQLGDQGEHHAAGGTEGIYQIGLLRSSKSLLIHMPDRAPVIRPLIANDDIRNGVDRFLGALSAHRVPSSP